MSGLPRSRSPRPYEEFNSKLQVPDGFPQGHNFPRKLSAPNIRDSLPPPSPLTSRHGGLRRESETALSDGHRQMRERPPPYSPKPRDDERDRARYYKNKEHHSTEKFPLDSLVSDSLPPPKDKSSRPREDIHPLSPKSRDAERGRQRYFKNNEPRSTESSKTQGDKPPEPPAMRRRHGENVTSTSDDSGRSSNSSDSGSNGSLQKPKDTGASQNTTENDTYSGSKNDEHYRFDVARVIPKERQDASESFEGILKVLRAAMYIWIFIVLLLCVVAATCSLLLIESTIRKDEVHRMNAESQLLWIICFPQILTFIISLGQTLFGDHQWPNKRMMLAIILIEAVHSFGLATLVFQVLPYFESIFAVGVMNTVCVIPGFLKILFTRQKHEKYVLKKVAFIVLDIVAVLVQIAGIIAPLAIITNGKQDIGQSSATSVKWQLPLSVIAISVKWWENFVSANRSFIRLKSLKKEIHKTRVIGSLYTSVTHIVTAVGCMFMFEWQYQQTNEYLHYVKPGVPGMYQWVANDTDNSTDGYWKEVSQCDGKGCVDDYFKSFAPAIVCIFCSLGAYYFSGLACKLLMQRWSFALPMVVSTPVVICMIFLQCYDVIPTISTGRLVFEYMCKDTSEYITIPIFCWLSTAWITRHIWFPSIDRLAYYQRIFVTKMFVSPVIIPSLMMNRRHDQQDNHSGIVFGADIDAVSSTYLESVEITSGSDSLEEKRKNRVVPRIYACGTMWHETTNEMIQLLKSIMRMDIDQSSRKIAEEFFKVIDPDYYEFETHIFFDDCLDIDDDDKWIPNKFVIQFIECMNEAASSVHKEERELDPPIKTPTPYGGRLKWYLPCGNLLYVHLKDKNKIRHRKRWSQVMYMYYLLAYKIFEEKQDEIADMLETNQRKPSNAGTDATTGEKQENKAADDNSPKKKSRRNRPARSAKGDLFDEMEDEVVSEVENTFILALDGDVDFKPDAVKLLVDRMRVNSHTGAACGRIHPIGTGPLVWYQVFEYAIGHWFQKATEHVLGCVLCSPGCFSLFRGSALLDDNVMKRYTTEPTEASHYIQYDQGEDRWLCTLLLQQGYRVDYCAASDALTYAPENFNEFFNQRRRWTPSTIANQIDLLSDAQNTVQMNANISYLYIMYQFILVVALILGPSTIMLAIATAFMSVLDVTLWQSYLLSLGPVMFYLVVCFKCKTDTQLTVAAFLSAFYACVMTVVLVGIIQTIVTQNILNPSLLFLGIISASFIFSGMIHPYEIFCLIHGILYYLCIPAGYLLLIIYSISNLHVVSWGTREVPKRKSKAQIARDKANEEKMKQEQAKKKSGILSYLRLDHYIKELKDSLTQIFSRTKETEEKSQKKTEKYMKRIFHEIRRQRLGDRFVDPYEDSDDERNGKQNKATPQPITEETIKQEVPIDEEALEIAPDDTENPNCLKYEKLGNGATEKLPVKEKIFFERLIKKYLYPIKKDAKKEEALKKELLALRTNASFGFWFINLLWVLFNYMINQDSKLNRISIYGLETQPLGFIFIIFFVIVLLLQIIGMLMHRWGTFLQHISITELRSPLHIVHRNSSESDNGGTEKISVPEARKIVRELQRQNTVFSGVNAIDDNIYEPVGPLDRGGKVDPRALMKNMKSNLRQNDRRRGATPDRNRGREEPLGELIDRNRQELRRRKREEMGRGTVRGRIRERFDDARSRDAYRPDRDVRPRTDRADPRGHHPGGHRRAPGGARRDDVAQRARQRLEYLARGSGGYRR